MLSVQVPVLKCIKRAAHVSEMTYNVDLGTVPHTPDLDVKGRAHKLAR